MDVRAGLAPGDVGAIVELHGRLYAAEHALDHRFEAGLARGLGEMVLGGFPRPHEGAWMVDDDGRVRGALLLCSTRCSCMRDRAPTTASSWRRSARYELVL